ncbi:MULTISPECIES: aminotransferase class V-fold PLP-dependent enzyme [Paraburkholderia]|nr:MULTISPECIES: aminotransferase class V-fold PLP-dependent enzyme [Paraburkholderia]
MYHSVGMFPDQQNAVRAALDTFVSQWYRPDQVRWEYCLQARQHVLDDWAMLIGAPSRAVFCADSVTEAFGKLVGALGRARLEGRRVLIAADCFPSLHFLLTGLAPVFGFTLDTVPLADNGTYVTDDAFVERWDDGVALAVITWVTSTASKRANLKRLTAHGRAQGSLIAVDITQGAGLLDFDIEDTPVDFVASTTLKWLCGAPGAGLAFLNPTLLDNGLAPATRGWFSQPDPFNWDLDRFSFAPDARRFDTGTPSFLPFIASAPGLSWRLSDASQGLRAYNLQLCQAIADVLEHKGYRLASPQNAEERGGSVMAQLPQHVDAKALESRLFEANVSVDTRGRVMRFSPGDLTHASIAAQLADLLPE